jgi:hypothetical protein
MTEAFARSVPVLARFVERPGATLVVAMTMGYLAGRHAARLPPAYAPRWAADCLLLDPQVDAPDSLVVPELGRGPGHRDRTALQDQAFTGHLEGQHGVLLDEQQA